MKLEEEKIRKIIINKHWLLIIRQIKLQNDDRHKLIKTEKKIIKKKKEISRSDDYEMTH